MNEEKITFKCPECGGTELELEVKYEDCTVPILKDEDGKYHADLDNPDTKPCPMHSVQCAKCEEYLSLDMWVVNSMEGLEMWLLSLDNGTLRRHLRTYTSEMSSPNLFYPLGKKICS